MCVCDCGFISVCVSWLLFDVLLGCVFLFLRGVFLGFLFVLDFCTGGFGCVYCC